MYRRGDMLERAKNAIKRRRIIGDGKVREVIALVEPSDMLLEFMGSGALGSGWSGPNCYTYQDPATPEVGRVWNMGHYCFNPDPELYTGFSGMDYSDRVSDALPIYFKGEFVRSSMVLVEAALITQGGRSPTGTLSCCQHFHTFGEGCIINHDHREWSLRIANAAVTAGLASRVLVARGERSGDYREVNADIREGE